MTYTRLTEIFALERFATAEMTFKITRYLCVTD